MFFVGLHGFGGGGSDFDQLVARIRPQKTWMPDLLVDGPLSPRHGIREWTENFVQQLEDLAGPEPVCALGYSMGGRLLLHALAQRPKAFHRAVIVSAQLGIESGAEVTARRQWEHKWSEAFSRQPWDQVWNDWNALEVFAGSTRKDIPRENRSSREMLALALSNWSPTRHLVSEVEIRTLPMPLLWVAGESDRKYAERYRQGQANGTLGQVRILAEAGHRVHQDVPDQLAEVVSQFFQS